jgi:hypothetical protein
MVPTMLAMSSLRGLVVGWVMLEKIRENLKSKLTTSFP